MQKITCLLLVSALLLATTSPAWAQHRLKIGVYDPLACGGEGASVGGLIRGLNRHGYQAECMTDLHMLTLLQYDVVYLSDMHSPGNVQPDWRKTISTFIKSGGSVLQTWHHHILGEVGVGIKRVYNSRRMHVKPGHPAVEGVSDFDALFRDHIIERVGPKGVVLIENDAGQPVAVAGKLGKGKVISTGLALAIPNGGSSSPPRGAELVLLRAFLAWLAPEVPRRERLAEALKTARLEVSPAEVMTAAGFQASFRALVGCPKRTDVRVTCEDANVSEDVEAGGTFEGDGAIRMFRIVVDTQPRKDTERECIVRARVGDKVLERKVRVKAVYGKAPKNERRGVWLHVKEDRHPKVVMPELKKLGINMAVPRIAGGTAAFYASKVQPDIQDPLAPDGDWLAETVKYAHANGIEIHPYVNNCVVEGRTSPESLARLRAEGRLQEGPDGSPINWFCPSQEVNFEAMERVMVEIATQYDVDGVQYDFIRYPGPQGCFCAKCRALFERETGKPVRNWPEDVITGPRHAEWVEFRCGRVSALVKRISTRIRKEAPHVKISAAVFRNWPDCRENNGQDWVRWCKEGWLDFVCPMNYTPDPERFAELAEIHRKAVPEGFPIVQGIGIASSSGRMNRPEQLALFIALARRAGAAGFNGFCYQPGHTSALFGPLRDWLAHE